MIVINGIDYTFHIFAAIFVVVIVSLFFAGQYILCKKAKHMAVKLIPTYVVFLLVILAILVTMGGTGGSFIDLRSFVAWVILGIASIGGVSLGAAWVIYRVKNKKINSGLSDK